MEQPNITLDENEVIQISFTGLEIINTMKAIQSLPYSVALPILQSIENQIVDKKVNKPT